MTKLPRKLLSLTLAATLMLSLNSPLATQPVFADYEETIAAYPDDTLALVSISLDPGNWAYLISRLAMGKKVEVKVDVEAEDADVVSPEPEAVDVEPVAPETAEPDSDDEGTDAEESTEMPSEVDALIEFLSNDLNFNPIFDGLLNLGSHLTLAYRPYPGTKGQLMFSLNLRSSDRVERVMKNFHAHMQKQGAQREFVRDHFGPVDLYSLRLPFEGDYVMKDFGRLHLAVSGHNLIGTIGPNPDLLKHMLYIQAVLPKHSGFKLANQPLFKPAREALEDKAAWVWVDLKQGAKQAEAVQKMFSEAAESESDEDEENYEAETASAEPQTDIVDQATTLFRGLGIGVDIAREGVRIKSFVVPDRGRVSALQADYLKAVEAEPEDALSALMAQMPDDPLLLLASQNLQVALTQAPPIGLPLDDLPFKEEDVRKLIQDVIGVEYRQDFLPLIDGRVALGLFKPRTEEANPDLVVYLGLKDGKETAFDQLTQRQLKFSPDALSKAFSGGEEAEISELQQNMRSLQNMLEIAAGETEGLYPADVATLKAELLALDDGNWNELVNPASGQSGLGAGLRDYAGMGEKPDVALAGTVFYKPMGEISELEGKTRHSGYAVYGYDPSGKLYRLDNSNDEFETVLDVLPKAAEQPKPAPQVIMPKLLESYMGSDIYALPLEVLPAGAPSDLEGLQPVYTRKGDIWMLSLSPEALKAAIRGGRPENLQRWSEDTASEKASGLFYLDVQGTLKQVKGFVGPFMPEGALDQVNEALAPWRSVFASSTHQNGGTEGNLVFDVDLDRLDLDAIGQLSNIGVESAEPDSDNSEGSDNELSAENSQVSANMHSIQEMVETYAVNMEDVYPANVEDLLKDAAEEGYGQTFSNPYLEDDETVLIDYSSYEAGPEMAGKVVYQPIEADGEILSYRIFGTDESGELIEVDGETLILSNE